MARYFPRPTTYHPGLELQLRQAVEGGDLLAAVRQIPELDPAARREAIVLVHGFNNHEGEASAAYERLRVRQYDRGAPALVPTALEQLFADLFWPGDAAWGRFDLADFLVYPAAVTTARKAAPRLADHLRAMPALLTVHFMGHSLGCRLVLETIEDLAANGGPIVGKVCLMAAAVPVFKVQPGGVLTRAMSHASEVRVLYSEADTVLKYAFPPGQTLAAGDEGFFPEAVGRFGRLSVTSGRIDPWRVVGARHSDYWGDDDLNAAAVSAADRVAGFFKFGRWARPVGESLEAPASRATADRREIGYTRVV